ncbi:hypothetical protein EDF18_0265 [Frigoribacterium sp. PhB107]|uniref:hypothetical protein n=1 Tax=Frigoribacterium sp. PhB107 TaxID=2485172 RepID=UPI000F47C53B|nr:hypothetical protein [Frigoribacterium sp. PhB107]ROP77636.1 hypothetical protein EDF18_0265 [Frigoribacterium sp. PhB107]
MSIEEQQPSRATLAVAHGAWMSLLAVGTLTFAAIPGFIGWCGTAATGGESEAQIAEGVAQAIKSMGIGTAVVAAAFVALPWARLKVRLLVTAGFVAVVALVVAMSLTLTR